jgi:multidrug efflux system membrane fusion protein
MSLSRQPVARSLVLLITASVLAIAAEPAIAQQAPPPPTQTSDRPGWLARQIETVKRWLSPASERVAVPAPGAAKGVAPPPTVTVSRPVAREIVEWDEYTGRFDAVDAVEIRARVSGYLTEVHFKDGQLVKAGDLLYSIDPRPFERALDQAKAELAQARTKVESSSKDVDRGRVLADRKILSEKVQDDRENVKREAEAAVKVAEAKMRLAELDLTFARITAPIAGRISRTIVGAGNWVSAGAASNATLLTTIVTQDPVHFYFDVSENNLLKYKRLRQQGKPAGGAEIGGIVEIALPDETGFPHRGRLDFSDNRLDPGTSTLRVRALVDNNLGLFSPGMFARVRIQGSSPYVALLLPDEAIGTDQNNKFVWSVVADGTVARKVVAPGPLVGGLRVIRSGITAEDWVVTKGVQRARPGQKVSPKREPIQVTAAPGAEAGAPPSKRE